MAVGFDGVMAACADEAMLAAIRIEQQLQPQGGIGERVYPPLVRREGRPAYPLRRWADPERGLVEAVVLDQRASQANRVEEALLGLIRRSELAYPTVTLRFEAPTGTVTLPALRWPHRIYDAYAKNSRLDGQLLFDTEVGQRLAAATPDNATALLEVTPETLLFGAWDAPKDVSVLGTRFRHLYQSEVVGLDPAAADAWAVRYDPLIRVEAEATRMAPGSRRRDWRISGHDNAEFTAESDAGKEVGKLSDIGLGMILAREEDTREVGGVAITGAVRVAHVSLTALRVLSFPDDAGQVSAERDAAGRAVLATLALLGDRAAFSRGGFSLRAGCDLEVLDDQVFFGAQTVDGADLGWARELYDAAVAEAARHGLSYRDDPLVVEPSDSLRDALTRAGFGSATAGEISL